MKTFSRVACLATLLSGVVLVSACGGGGSVRASGGAANMSSGRYAMSLPEIRKAANSGDADAQYALGFMYYYGKQVDRDMTLAKKWIRKAAAQGQKRAITAMTLLGESAPAVAPKANFAAKQKTTRVAAMKPTQQYTEKSTKGSTAKITTITKATSKSRHTTPVMAKNSSAPINAAITPKTQVIAANSSKPSYKVSQKQLNDFQKKLLKKQDDHFTLQLLGSRHLDQVEAVVEQNHLAKNSAIYHTYFKNKDWYVLVYGDYETPDDALSAIDRLPPMAQQLKPWVKPFASVKVGLSMHKKA